MCSEVLKTGSHIRRKNEKRVDFPAKEGLTARLCEMGRRGFAGKIRRE